MAKIRGRMKRPYRIVRKVHKESRLEEELDKIDLLGDDEILKPLPKKVAPAKIVVPPRDRTKGAEIHHEKFVQKILAEKEKVSMAAQQPKGEAPTQTDPWSNDTIKPPYHHTFLESNFKRPQAQSAYAVHAQTAYSYNPDQQMLKAAQERAAREYLDDKIELLKWKVNSSKQRKLENVRRLSEEAFLQLNGDSVFKIVDDEDEKVFDAEREQFARELEELTQLRETIGDGDEVKLDLYEERRSELEEYVQQLTQENEEFAREINDSLRDLEERKKSLDPHKTTASRERAQLFEEQLLELHIYTNENTKLINQFKKELKQFQKDERISYELPLRSETGSLRKIKALSGAEEQFIGMKNAGEFGDLAVKDKYIDSSLKLRDYKYAMILKTKTRVMAKENQLVDDKMFERDRKSGEWYPKE